MNQEELKNRHEQSVREYPDLNLGDEEFVIRSVKKHIGGQIKVIGIAALAILITVLFLIVYPLFFAKDFSSPDYLLVFLFGVGIILLALILCSISLTVRKNNRFFLTNKSIIQQTQTTLFAKSQKAVGLGNIEDISFDEKGFAETLFGFGSICVISDQGKQTTYKFENVANPRTEMRILNNAVEAFKEGRPVIGE